MGQGIEDTPPDPKEIRRELDGKCLLGEVSRSSPSRHRTSRPTFDSWGAFLCSLVRAIEKYEGQTAIPQEAVSLGPGFVDAHSAL